MDSNFYLRYMIGDLIVNTALLRAKVDEQAVAITLLSVRPPVSLAVPATKPDGAPSPDATTGDGPGAT